MENEEKIERDFKVGFDFDWTYGVSVQKMKSDLEVLEKLGATQIDIESEDSYGSCSVVIKAMARRLETDEECNARIAEQNRRKETTERLERQQFEKLKAKFGTH